MEVDYRRQLEDWLRQHPPQPKDEIAGGRDPGEERHHLRRLRPQDRLDLHGLTVEEAKRQADRFLRESYQRGLLKVLIIHGKGHHSERGKGVLKESIRLFLASHPLTGETGVPDREEGGEGAVWVTLRPRGYRSR